MEEKTLSTFLHGTWERGVCQLEILDGPSWGRGLTMQS